MQTIRYTTTGGPGSPPRAYNGNADGGAESSDSETQIGSPIMTKMSSSFTSTTRKIVKVERETEVVKQRLISSLDNITEKHFEHFSLDQYLSYISHERMMYLPVRGTQWDRVLMEAEFFGLQLATLAETVCDLVPGADGASDAALASCHLLLELGSHQAPALESTFNALYELGRLLTQCIRLRSFFQASEEIKQDLSYILSDIVHSVSHVAVYYRQRIDSMSESSVTIDFDDVFGGTIGDIYTKRDQLVNNVWNVRLCDSPFKDKVDDIRRCLRPSELSVEPLLYSRTPDRGVRAEGTCEWVDHHLVNFLRSDDLTFTLTGDEGCGKTVIASWIQERLLWPVDYTRYEVISYRFADDIPQQTLTLSFLKGLLCQLFHSNVGDAQLYEKLTVAYEKLQNGLHDKDIEPALWNALEAGIAALNKHHVNLIIVIDGLDTVEGGPLMAIELHEHLDTIIRRFRHVHVITTCLPLAQHIWHGRHHAISQNDTAADMRRAVMEWIGRSHAKIEDNGRKEKLIKMIVSRANGSFLWAKLAVELFPADADCGKLMKMIEKWDGDISQLLHRHVDRINTQDQEVRALLSYMCVAERPFAIEEMEDLLRVNVKKRTVSTPATTIHKVIEQHFPALVTDFCGFVRFHHQAVREFMISECGKALPSVKEAHKDLVIRILLFARCTLPKGYEQPSIEGLSPEPIEQIFHQHSLNEYAMRRWINHFRASSMHSSSRKVLDLDSNFEQVFPHLVFMPLTEWACWSLQTPIEEIIARHELALRIRTKVLGDNASATLQNLIILGHLYRQHNDDEKSAEYFFRTCEIGQIILSKFSPIVISCSNTFLSITETMKFTTRTTIFTYREKMIRFMIEVSRSQRGARRDSAVHWFESLKQLYKSIGEEEQAGRIYKEFQDVSGHSPSSPTEGAFQPLAGLKVVLSKQPSDEAIEQYKESFFRTIEQHQAPEVRISMLLQLTDEYLELKRWVLAEEMLIYLWQHVSEKCRLTGSKELQEQKIQITCKYYIFLKDQKRLEEARGILICIWAEYEHSSFESEVIVAKLREVAVGSRERGLYSICVSILRRLWKWYKTEKAVGSIEIREISTLLIETIEEIERSDTDITITVTETFLSEVYEFCYSRCKTTKVDHHFYKICVLVVDIYVKREKWIEAEIILRQSLALTWDGFFTHDVTLIGECMGERLMMAKQLAICYVQCKRYDEAEKIYVRIFHACRDSFGVTDTRVTESYQALVVFYEELHRHRKVAEIHSEMLELCHKDLERNQIFIIKTMYALARVYLLQGRKEGYDTYAKIVTTLNKNNRKCHPDAVEACLVLIKYYYNEQCWEELESTCQVLWNTFANHHHEYSLTAEHVQLIFERYRFALEHDSKIDYSRIYKIAREYRDTVNKAFKDSATLMISACMTFAEICEQREQYYEEAITTYEEILTKYETIHLVSETHIRMTKRRLSSLYVKEIRRGNTTTNTTFPEMVNRAITLCWKVYQHLRVEFGWFHETTLLKLHDLLTVYKKQTGKKLLTKMEKPIEILQQTLICAINSVPSATVLRFVGDTIGSMLVELGYTKEAHDILTQLYDTLMLGDEATNHLKFPKTLPKLTIILIIAFEHRLCIRGDHAYSISELLASYHLEITLLAHFRSAIAHHGTQSEKAFLLPSARLRTFWTTRKRHAAVAWLDTNTKPLFLNRYKTALSSSNSIEDKEAWYVALLAELGASHAGVATAVEVPVAACRAAVHGVTNLLDANAFGRAANLTGVANRFCAAQGYYKEKECVVLGFGLAERLARRAGEREELRKVSGEVVASVLSALKEAGVEIVAFKLEDLDRLVRLLGDLGRWEDLEFILSSLFRSRQVQKTWSPATVLRIASLLVDVHAQAGHTDRASQLASTLLHNLRASRGGVDMESLDMAAKLARIVGHGAEAAAVHEDALREIDIYKVHHGPSTHNGHGRKKEGIEAENIRLRAAAARHLAALRREVWRDGWSALGGQGGKRGISELFTRLSDRFGDLGLPAADGWETGKGKVDRSMEKDDSPTVEWKLVIEDSAEKETRNFVVPARERWGMCEGGEGLTHVGVAWP